MTWMTASSASPAVPRGRSGQLETSRQLAVLAVGFFVCAALIPVHIDRAFGLPAHPLLLHVPVILDPILAIACLVLAFRPALRARHGLVLAVFALVSLLSTVLAAGAGQAFYDRRPFVQHVLREHRQAGETLRLAMFALTAAVLVLVALDWMRRTDRGPERMRSGTVATGLSVVVAVLGIGCGFLTVRAGHLGAKATWARDGRGGFRDGPPGGFPGGGRFPRGRFPGGPGQAPPGQP
jgi:hypothetical protein